MKRLYGAQVVIDVFIIILCLVIYSFPVLTKVNANIVFYTLLSVYAGLELLEFILSQGKLEEALYLFGASAVAAFSGIFLRNFEPSTVISITLLVWILMISIIKIISLEKIYKKKTRLFVIKLGCTSAIILIGILVSINLYYRMSELIYMLTLMYICYGFLELLTDTLEYLSDDIKFLKE